MLPLGANSVTALQTEVCQRRHLCFAQRLSLKLCLERIVVDDLKHRLRTQNHDIADNQAAAGAAQVLIPGARRLVIEDAGHLMQFEHPKELAGIIADFVKMGR